MSFSSEVKEELFTHLGKSRHCQIAELAAILIFEGKLCRQEDTCWISLQSDNQLLHEKYELLLHKLFHFSGEPGSVECQKILETVRLWNESEEKPEWKTTVDGILIQQTCCKRAFLRGAFLAAGSMSDPNKSYHFEIVCKDMAQGEQLCGMINSFGMDAKIVARKNHQVVYLKEGSQIVDMLNIIEAHISLMNLENVRILKEMRNSVNRKVNCETANISKTVTAAVKQVQDIEYIKETAGLESLPDNLKAMAILRLEYPEAALKELGAYLNPTVGKSGVNHRLRKISMMAEDLRNQTGGAHDEKNSN